MRLSGRAFVIIAAALGILIVVSTDQIVPASSAYQAQMRLWLAGRATGITAYLLLTGQVVFGLILSHPVNQSTWKLSKRLFQWHENLLVFVLAFLAAHIVSLILDPYAGVGLGGAFIPGLSSYRTSPVALGTLGLYALLVTGLTARYTKLLPPGFWLKLHRFAIVALVLAWMHGMLAGSDATALQPMYVATGTLVLLATAYRYWVSKRQRPTFATSLPDDARRTAGVIPSAGVLPTVPSAPEATP
jgi:predicted ferric reductase